MPIFLLAQNDNQFKYRTGVGIGFGIGKSEIKTDNATFFGNSSTFSVRGDFSFKNGIFLHSGIDLLTINFNSLANNNFNSNVVTILKTPIKIGYSFNLDKENKSNIRLLPQAGFYYSTLLSLKQTNSSGNSITDKQLGGNFGFITGLGISFDVSSALYSIISFNRSTDFDSVKSINFNNLKIENDQTINLSFGYLF